MCYAIPGKLVEIKGNIGIIDYYGEKRKALVDFSGASVGDYVYAQGGILIKKISEKDALEVIDAWKEMFFELKKVDERQADIHKADVKKNILELFQKINQKKTLERHELLSLFKLERDAELKLLYETANNIRQKEHGNACCVHGIIEFSNFCGCNCFYCGIRKESGIKRYRMSSSEILSVAEYAVRELKFTALLLQSGEDSWYDEDILAGIVSDLRKLGILVFLSIGSRSRETYKKLYDAGARAVLLRFETSNKSIFEELRPGTVLEERLDLIRYIKSLGFVLATGFITGLPGETEEDLLNNILMTISLKPDMLSFGPFINAKGTPLEKHGMVEKSAMMKAIAVARIADRDSNILVTTAFETFDKDARRKGLLSGANSLMLNITPKKYRDLYSIYDNKAGSDEDVKYSIKKAVDLLKDLGRAPVDLGRAKSS